MTTAALVLAGGRSSRMGSPKPNVKLHDGRTMLAHVLDSILPLGVPVHLSVEKDHAFLEHWSHLPVIRDAEEYPGPLAAITQALGAIEADELLVVCCDQPMLQADLLRRLVDSAIDLPTFFRDAQGRGIAPFPGIYPASLLTAMRDALSKGERSPRRFVETRECTWVDIDAAETALLASFNSMDELARAGLLAVEVPR